MATMLGENVIKFPDNPRAMGGGPDRSRLLVQARNLFVQKMREATRSLLSAASDELGAKGDVADEREQRTLYHSGRDLLCELASRLEGAVAGHCLTGFDAMTSGRGQVRAEKTDSDELELVDIGDMEAEIARKALVGRLQEGCEDGLFAAGRRLAFLAGHEDTEFALEPVMAGAFDEALKEAGLPGTLRLEILQILQRHAVEGMGPVIHAVNAFLVGRNILPRLRRRFTRGAKKATEKTAAEKNDAAAADVFALLQRLVGASAGSAAAGHAGTPGQAGGGMSPGAMAAAMEQVMGSLDALQRAAASIPALPSSNVLRDFRGSAVGQNLGHLDAVTVDIVATLFDFIFDDPAVPDPIKALVARLQIPVLKVAMLDKTFFSSKSHPARRLLDSISRAASRCGREINHQDPLYAKIAGIIERLQVEFAQDTGLFDVLGGELNDFLAGQEAEADARAERAAPLVAKVEQREMAAVAADQALADWLSGNLPVGVSDLLTHEWRALLVHHYLNGDEGTWTQTVAVAGDLVASVVPPVDAPGRKRLASELPGLVKKIHDGLNLLQVPVERRVTLLDGLFSIHAAVLRGAAPVVTTPLPAAPEAAQAIVSESVELDGAQLQSISLVDAVQVPVRENDEADSQQQVDQLQRGDWVEFGGGEAPRLRYRLSWISPERGILLFTNPQSPRALSVAPAALALQIERGEASIVPVEPIFERAVSRALESLQQAA